MQLFLEINAYMPKLILFFKGIGVHLVLKTMAKVVTYYQVEGIDLTPEIGLLGLNQCVDVHVILP